MKVRLPTVRALIMARLIITPRSLCIESAYFAERLEIVVAYPGREEDSYLTDALPPGVVARRVVLQLAFLVQSPDLGEGPNKEAEVLAAGIPTVTTPVAHDSVPGLVPGTHLLEAVGESPTIRSTGPRSRFALRPT